MIKIGIKAIKQLEFNDKYFKIGDIVRVIEAEILFKSGYINNIIGCAGKEVYIGRIIEINDDSFVLDCSKEFHTNYITLPLDEHIIDIHLY